MQGRSIVSLPRRSQALEQEKRQKMNRQQDYQMYGGDVDNWTENSLGRFCRRDVGYGGK